MFTIRVIDFETTGEAPPAEVCEVGICDMLLPDRTITRMESWLCAVKNMPPDVRAVHHISKAECGHHPPFDPARMELDKVDAVAAHNANFELKFVDPPVPVICTFKAALRVWPDAPTHSNGGLRYWLEDQGLIRPMHHLTLPAHRAGPDAYVTALILGALLNTGATGKEMVQWTREPALLPRCPIGKFRGMQWCDVEGGFLQWMTRQGDMDADLKWLARRELALRNSLRDV